MKKNSEQVKMYSVVREGKKYTWMVERLWKLSSELEQFEYSVKDFKGLNEDCWYCGVNIPTVKSVLNHMKRINESDLSYPIILSESGEIMDGLHRICKALISGEQTIPAVRFLHNPEPDKVEPILIEGTDNPC